MEQCVSDSLIISDCSIRITLAEVTVLYLMLTRLLYSLIYSGYSYTLLLVFNQQLDWYQISKANFKQYALMPSNGQTNNIYMEIGLFG